MLGLRPRLKAPNSLWDLVNKHPPHLHSSSPPSWKQPVEEGADGLPPSTPPLPLPLPRPFSSSSSSPEQEPHNNHSSESSVSFSMAPVSSTTSIPDCSSADRANGSQRKIPRGHGRRLGKINTVRLYWSQVLSIRELDNADGRIAQDPSSPSPGMVPIKINGYTF